MPYITEERQAQLAAGYPPSTAGELNYTLTSIAIQYIQDNGLSYGIINDILGAFSGASAEFYRRVAVPYEDTKIAENGDVYPPLYLNGKAVKTHG